MVRKVRGPLLMAVVSLFTWASAGRSQEPALPAAPVPVNPSGAPVDGPRPLPPPLYPQHAPSGLGPPACALYEDHNGPLLKGDPYLDRPEAPPGFFAAAEIGLVGPHIKNRLQATFPFPGSLPNVIHLPSAEMDWTGSPRVEIGYRLTEGFGEFLIGYHSLAVESEGTIPNFDPNGDGLLNSRLNLNVLDLAYRSREFSLAPSWDMRWTVGARLASIYFDTWADAFARFERTSNNFLGAGPFLALDLARQVFRPGLEVFGRVEGATLLGRIGQSFEEEFDFDDGTVAGGAVTVHKTQAVPMIHVQTGLGYSLPGGWTHLALGYELEQWWYLGHAGDSRAELTTQGIFLRAGFDF